MDLNKNPRYKLYVRLRESIVFDAALNEAEIDYTKEEDPVDEYIRYYFKLEDYQKVDQINKNLQLSISTETIPSLDFELTKRNLVIYIIIGSIVAVIILVISLL